jgi:DUF4097 and DUF4098 domain-containing protein YvlB
MQTPQKPATWLAVSIGTLLAILAWAVPSHASDWLTQEFHQTYTLSADGRVSIENINGFVHVSGWDKNEVQVDAVKRARRQDRLDEAKIVVDASSTSVSIHTEYPDRGQTFTTGDRNNPATVDYTVHVPRRARLDEIKLVNGELEIQDIAGDVRAESVNGSVEARNLSGRTELSAVNGHTEAAFQQLPSEPVKISSVNGSLVLTIPSDSQADLRASTVSGGIDTNFGFQVHHGQYVGHDVAGRLGNGGTRIELENVNGHIDIRHANDNRPLSPATTQSHRSNDKDDDDDDD